MSKKYQYKVSSRKRQTAIHRKERRKEVQRLADTDGAATESARQARRRRRAALRRAQKTTELASSAKPRLMACSLRQSLGSLLTEALQQKSGHAGTSQ
jgi:hypothetical protein